MQQMFYTKYKRTHGLLYQAVVMANGICIDLHGPASGRHNDLHLVNASNMTTRLEALVGPNGSLGIFARILGDRIYNPSTCVTTAYHGKNLPPVMRDWNISLSASRIEVEHFFALVFNNWPHLRQARNFKIYDSWWGISWKFRVGVLLTNIHACFNQNQTSLKFGLSPPCVEDYLAGCLLQQDLHID